MDRILNYSWGVRYGIQRDSTTNTMTLSWGHTIRNALIELEEEFEATETSHGNDLNDVCWVEQIAEFFLGTGNEYKMFTSLVDLGEEIQEAYSSMNEVK